MSKISIECNKTIDTREDGPLINSERFTLNLHSEQWFMDTIEFFDNIKDSLEKYFDKIEIKEK